MCGVDGLVLPVPLCAAIRQIYVVGARSWIGDLAVAATAWSVPSRHLFVPSIVLASAFPLLEYSFDGSTL